MDKEQGRHGSNHPPQKKNYTGNSKLDINYKPVKEVNDKEVRS